MSTHHQWIQPEHPTFLFAQEDEAAGVRNFGIDSLHKIAHQVSAGHTLDEILATALSVISAVTGSESSFTYILHNGKFEPWIWKTPERVDSSELSLEDDIATFLARYKAPVAIAKSVRGNRSIRILEDWSRDPGETSISVPLLSRTNLVGAISFRHAPRAYTDREVKFLSTIGFIIGADVGISLAEAENAAVREELETRKLVERGKGGLQRDLRVSEQQAYLMLEHLTRLRRKSMKEIARAIILSDEVKRGSVVG